MQRSLGAGGVHRLRLCFAVPVKHSSIERAVHATLKDDGKHLSTGSAKEWFTISPEDAKFLVEEFATGRRNVEHAISQRKSKAKPKRDRSSIRGGKVIKATPKRNAALAEVLKAADIGGYPADFPGGKWGAAATALAAQEGITKAAALIIMREWFF